MEKVGTVVHVSPISASLNDILAFLAAQFHAGHGYPSLNVYRSAISSIHPKIDDYEVGSHSLVCRLLLTRDHHYRSTTVHDQLSLWSLTCM